jgi:cephalosporin-C deacetylase-like acetyl esterase
VRSRKNRCVLGVLGALTAVLVLAPASHAAIATIPASHDGTGTIPCVVQAANDNERWCSGIFTTFDGAPIDINVGFPQIPSGGATDGDFPVIGVFHGWGGSKLDLDDDSMQQWLNDGYAVFSMSDRGWGLSCGATDPKRLTPPVCDNGYNHLMDTRYEVRDAQELFEALADQQATPGATGLGLIDP